MKKYDERFKLSVVQPYLDGAGGYKAIAKQHGLDHEMFRRWVRRFQVHGIDGLKKKFTHYSAALKLSVLRHMRDNALSCGQVAALFNMTTAQLFSSAPFPLRLSMGLDPGQTHPIPPSPA